MFKVHRESQMEEWSKIHPRSLITLPQIANLCVDCPILDSQAEAPMVEPSSVQTHPLYLKKQKQN